MDELTEEQQRILRDALTDLQSALLAVLGQSKDAAQPVQLDQQSVGRLSRMDAIQQQKMVEANRHRTAIRLQQVKAAFRAMGAGEYGLCRRCEEPISFARLKAQPEGAFCLQCQRTAERR